MKTFKKIFLKSMVILSLSMMASLPLMAKSITIDIGGPSSGVKLTIPNYIGMQDINICDKEPDFSQAEFIPTPSYKITSIAISDFNSDHPFKLTIDADKFPEADCIGYGLYRANYFTDYDTYSQFEPQDHNIAELTTNNLNEKEAWINYSTYSGSNYFYLVGDFEIHDKRGNSLYLSPDFHMHKPSPSNAAKIPRDIAININGKKISSSINPIQDKGTTFVPVRLVSENLGALVDYDSKTKEITITKDDNIIKFHVGSKQALTNGITSTLTAAPRLSGSTTLVPIRMIAETFNSNVYWDEDTHTVIITEK